MRRIVIIIAGVLLAAQGFCQTLSVEAYIQESRLGIQKGYGIYYLNRSGWGVGPVFQSEDGISNEVNRSNYPFVGLEFRVPLQNCGRLRLQLAPKIGFVNRDFLAIIPEIQTEYQFSNAVGMGVGAGIRVREAAISVKVYARPFKKNKQ